MVWIRQEIAVVADKVVAAAAGEQAQAYNAAAAA